MAVVCPYCEQRIHFKAMPPGDYRPSCPKCLQAFAMAVPEPSGAPWRARPLSHETFTPHETGPHHPAAEAVELDFPRPMGRIASNADNPADPAALARTNPDLGRRAPSAKLTARIGKPLDTHTAVVPIQMERGEAEVNDLHPPPPREIRGFRIDREIGRGGMGSVYLARQLSLDRPVALKVMSKKWAADPVFVARFTREAYAAAQLSHPNIVRIFDIGEAEGTQFFSMEFVPGECLAEVVRRQGKLDPETAVGYVLQAARGLKHAHDRGMIHRDVKPDNLLLDDQGVVKVADLGLVKTPVSTAASDILDLCQESGLGSLPHDMTGTRIALGTPAYMSPEQCRDAAAVDHRADIYSLGCTLYVLVTGRPPFDGMTAVELMTKHAYEAIVPPDQLVARVPKEVSAVIQKMMQKDPNDRFADMGEVVKTLEAWLGVLHAGTFTPQENQIGRLETFVQEFQSAPAAVLRGRVVNGFFATLALAVVLLAFFGQLTWAFGLIGLGVQSTLAYFVLDGVARKGHLFRRTRQFASGLSWGDWTFLVAWMVLFNLFLGMLQVFWLWSGFGLIGIGLAIALRFGLDRTIEVERAPALRACEQMMMRMRLQGLSEDELRQFVTKFAGRQWEEFFEALFGFEAKLAARTVLLRGGSAGPRDKHAAWREPILNAMDRIEKGRQESRERRLLVSVERANFLANGMAEDAAQRQAAASAATMVRRAAEPARPTTAGPPGARRRTRWIFIGS